MGLIFYLGNKFGFSGACGACFLVLIICFGSFVEKGKTEIKALEIQQKLVQEKIQIVNQREIMGEK